MSKRVISNIKFKIVMFLGGVEAVLRYIGRPKKAIRHLNRFRTRYFSTFAKEHGYVKAATYFGNAWQMNFWNCKWGDVYDQLNQIKNDGFNSIVIVLPWREFQPGVCPINYNMFAFGRLKELMGAAKKVGLDVYARLGYTWDFYNDSEDSIYHRYLNLFKDSKYLDAWVDYVKNISTCLEKYKGFKGAFITWEDFWYSLFVCDIDDFDTRLKLASEMGFHEWIKTQYIDVNDFNNKYKTIYRKISDIPVPHKDDPVMEEFYAFYDGFLNKLLTMSQKVYSKMSMEVRLDKDLIVKPEGYKRYFSHRATFVCGSSDYVCTMYAIPMNCINNGEKLPWRSAIKMTEKTLRSFNKAQNKPVFIDQFLFKDNTSGFSHNAQIRDGEEDDYLRHVYRVLKRCTSGYAIWTYKDYVFNMVYNPNFILGLNGWDSHGVVYVTDDKCDDFICHVEEDSSLEQKVPESRNGYREKQYILSFYVYDCADLTECEITFGSNDKKHTIVKGQSNVVMFDEEETFDFKIAVVKGFVEITDIKLYSFTQHGDLYDVNGKEQKYIESIRYLNSQL